MSKAPPPGTDVPAPGEGKRGTDGHIGYLLRQASMTHRNRLERALSDIGVTPPQFLVLTMLAAYPGQSNADLARLAMLTPQTVSVIVGNLLKAGALSRRPHAVHGRIQHLDLTDSGQALLDAARERATTVEQELTRGLPAAAEQTIREWLVAVAISGAKT